MVRRKEWRILIIGLLSSVVPCVSTGSEATSPSATSEVRSLDSGELLYLESYWSDKDGNLEKISYQMPSGETFGEKRIKPSSVPGLISYEQSNDLANRKIAVSVLKSEGDHPPQRVELKLLYRSQKKTVEKEVKSSKKRHVIVDAGFDAFVRAHWDKLSKGERIPAQFPIASRGKLVKLFITESDCKSHDSERVCFRVRLQSRLLRLFIDDPVYAEYDPNNRRLIRYQGIGNVALENGEVPAVDIQLSYPDAQEESVAELDFHAPKRQNRFAGSISM